MGRKLLSALCAVVAAALVSIAAPAFAQPRAEPNSCATCHATLADARLSAPANVFAGQDVHREKGFACIDCHGGNPTTGDKGQSHDVSGRSSAMAFRGKPTGQTVIATCARCHSDAEIMRTFAPKQRVDQATEYATSVHGKRLATGDTNVATCASCHGAHGVRMVSDAKSPVFPTNVATTCASCHADTKRMGEYKLPDGSPLPTHQFADYQQSVHFTALTKNNDLSAPTCNDCHGNHGARPPEVESMAFVCGTCHGKQAELFRQATMKPAFDEAELGECIVCHGNHRIVAPSDELLFHAPLADGARATGCYTCHPDAADAALAISTAVHADLGGLEARIAEARATLADADAKGMPVAEAEYELTGATDALVEARALVHLFRREPVDEACARGTKVADAALAQGHAAIEAFYFRHRWLGVSLVGIAFVITSLWLKLRQVDRRWRQRLAHDRGAPSPPASRPTSAPTGAAAE